MRLADGKTTNGPVTLLLKVRELYDQLSQESGWTDFIAQLRERNRRLPALLDELNIAGL